MYIITTQLLQELDLTPFDPSTSDGEAHPEKNRYTYNLPCQSSQASISQNTSHLI